MAQNTLGQNITFPIYNADGTPFYGLELKKSTVESVVMSLGDKITGDVYYRDNTLSVSMQEYIMFNGVKYTLVSPPTIVREGMVADNSQLKGITKYSFTFYHPMYMLGNFPFTDIAVTLDEERYLSQNKTFSWIGTLFEFIAKLNTNLANTEWLVVSNIAQNTELWDKASKLSDVLSFDKSFISDALSKAYETWEIPFVITQHTQIVDNVQKNFKIEFGMPIEEIYTTNEQSQSVPFVFRFGQGVGLKNNSRTPRNNKIVTRIIGEGSDRNIPYGYPQIRWYGDPDAEFTYGNQAGVYTDVDVVIGGTTYRIPKLVSYPIYKGILGGEYVALIKHPFTRKNLMPQEYRTSLYNKICYINSDNTYNTNYDPDTEIVDYIDAIGSTYVHEINPLAPSSEIHTFEDIYPQLVQNDDYTLKDAYPVNDSDMQRASSWDDTMDDEGNYTQGYFKVKLPQLQFDIYACAAITQNMQINMRGGACLGCTFDVQVDWEDYKKNFYKDDGTFDPIIHTTTGDGHVRDGSKYPDSSIGEIEVIVKKDIETFGTIMPNVYQQVKGETTQGANDGDKFVILGISLPNTYIESAETKLSYEMALYMKDNNDYYYDYPLKFDEYFLAKNTDILSQIENNKKLRFQYAGQEITLYIKQISIKYGESALPQYDIVLTDDIDVVVNQIGRVEGELRHISDTFVVMNNDIRTSINHVGDEIKNGRINRFYYYAQEWVASDLVGYVVTESQAPYFSYNGEYWIFNPKDNGLYSLNEMGTPRENSVNSPSSWLKMLSTFKYIITEAIFSQYAHLGSFIINGDWMISQHGIIFDSSDNKHVIDATHSWDSYNVNNAYTMFDPAYPNVSKPNAVNFSPNYCVDGLTGKVYMYGAFIQGEVHAGSGEIGGLIVQESSIHSTARLSDDTDYMVRISADGSWRFGNIYGSTDGLLHAGGIEVNNVYRNTFGGGGYVNTFTSKLTTPEYDSTYATASSFPFITLTMECKINDVKSTDERTYLYNNHLDMYKDVYDNTGTTITDQYDMSLDATSIFFGRVSQGSAFLNASGVHQTSDIRLKDIKQDCDVSLEQVANAPLFYYTYKKDKTETLHVGTSAQYWQDILPMAVGKYTTKENDEEKEYLNLNYDDVSTVSALITAKEVLKMKQEISSLKAMIEEMKNRIKDD